MNTCNKDHSESIKHVLNEEYQPGTPILFAMNGNMVLCSNKLNAMAFAAQLMQAADLTPEEVQMAYMAMKSSMKTVDNMTDEQSSDSAKSLINHIKNMEKNRDKN